MRTIPFLYTLSHFAKSSQIIKNVNTPSCRNCIYYKPMPYSSDLVSPFNKCEKFGNKNIITSIVTYDFAEDCRRDETRCGKDGRYFELEPNMRWKELKHAIFSRPFWSFIVLETFFIIWCIVKR